VILAVSLFALTCGAQPSETVATRSSPVETVDLANLTLLPQTRAPIGVRPLRPGEADVSIVGRRTSARTFILTMQLGRLFTRGVKIYSEPSHTLLLVGMTREASETAAGRALKRVSVSFTGAFPDSVHLAELPAAPPGDDALLIYCIREAGDYLVAAGHSRDGDFDFQETCRTCR